MIVTTLKRTEKMNPLDQIKPVGELDDPKDLEVQDSNVKKALMAYQSALNNDTPINSVRRSQIDDTRHKFNFFRDTYKTVLLPDEITIFEKIVTEYEGHRNFREHTGLFLSALIKNSYDAGNNNFNFETNNIEGLGILIKGSEKNPIIMNIGKNHEHMVGIGALDSTINIEENHGARVGSTAEESTINIQTNYGDEVGSAAKHSTIKIQTNYGDEVGISAAYSTIDIQTNYGDEVGSGALDSTINIEENHGGIFGIGAHKSIFKSSNKETLDSIKVVSKKYNKFYLIKDGKEIPYKK